MNVDQGMTYSRRFVWKINSNPVNLTSYTAALIVGSSSGYQRGLTLTSAANGGIVLGTSDGSIEVTFTPAQTAALRAGSHSYALELTSPTGVKTRILRGTLINTPRISSAVYS